MIMWYFAGGDAGFYFAEQLKKLSWLSVVWHPESGFGELTLFRMWFDYPYQLLLKLLSSLGFSWFIIDKVLWIAVLVVGISSSYSLGTYIFKKKLPALVASFIYMVNTYSMLLFAGGQIGVSLAYAFSPFVLLKFIQIDNKEPRTRNQQLITNGLCLALLITFDLRLAYVVLGVVVLYHLVTKTFRFWSMSISFIVAALIHSFWILPTVLTRTGPSVMGEDFTNPGMLKFLSVADFSHTLSLLHPNWPENLFGKVYFLQPEFLVLPILAFASLLFLSKNKELRTLSRRQAGKNHHPVFFFALLALIGAFFAKGVNPPAGGIFQWMFQYVPGFVMFRDPTKFYLFIALGYSILIPFTLGQLAHVVGIKYQVSSIKYKKGIRNTLYVILYTLFVVFWLITLRAVFTGEVRGNFRPIQLPQEYVSLKDKLVIDTVPSRTLWIPNKENFAYYSDVHPLLEMGISKLSVLATSSAFLSTLNVAGVKYVVVPMDIEGKFFMSDYTYDDQMRQKVITVLQQTPLKQFTDYKEIAVFENPQFQSMKITIPDVVRVQQFYANVGLLISAVVLIVIIILIVWL